MSNEMKKDPDSGSVFIPSTQRPDGTWRKARRVKDGYVPQEEVPLYESKGKQWAKGRPDYPVGLAPEDIEEHHKNKNAQIPGLEAETAAISKSAKKNAKRKQKKKCQGSAKLDNKMSELQIQEDMPELAHQNVTSDNQKRLRNLRKKIKDIEVLEMKIQSGELVNPDKDQIEKVRRKSSILEEINKLETQE